jgi:hypothetical protein
LENFFSVFTKRLMKCSFFYHIWSIGNLTFSIFSRLWIPPFLDF